MASIDATTGSATNQPPKTQNQALPSRPKEFCNRIPLKADSRLLNRERQPTDYETASEDAACVICRGEIGNNGRPHDRNRLERRSERKIAERDLTHQVRSVRVAGCGQRSLRRRAGCPASVIAPADIRPLRVESSHLPHFDHHRMFPLKRMLHDSC